MLHKLSIITRELFLFIAENESRRYKRRPGSRGRIEELGAENAVCAPLTPSLLCSRGSTKLESSRFLEDVSMSPGLNFWSAHLSALDAKGMTTKVYAQQHGLSVASL